LHGNDEGRDLLYVADISAKSCRIGKRVTDPNNPTYHINGLDIADDRYTKPKAPKKFIEDSFLLKTKDITGASSDSRGEDRFQRREVKNTNFVGDISGACADSIKHSIVTNRTTNPLQPVFLLFYMNCP
jgi:hypothetical protein